MSPATLVAQCTFQKDEPTCNQPAFRTVFAAARTVSYNKADLHPDLAKQLSDFLDETHKQIVPTGAHSALFFSLTLPDINGVFVGPSGVVLARLRVYGPDGRTLLWEETYMDQPDVPQQAAVFYLLQQLHDRFATN